MRWMKGMMFNDAIADRPVSDNNSCIYDTDGDHSKEQPSVENPSMICLPCIINGDTEEQATEAQHDSRAPYDFIRASGYKQGENHFIGNGDQTNLFAPPVMKAGVALTVCPCGDHNRQLTASFVSTVVTPQHV